MKENIRITKFISFLFPEGEILSLWIFVVVMCLRTHLWIVFSRFIQTSKLSKFKKVSCSAAVFTEHAWRRYRVRVFLWLPQIHLDARVSFYIAHRVSCLLSRCSIWPSSLFLSEFVLSYPELFTDRSCFEVSLTSWSLSSDQFCSLHWFWWGHV